MSTYLNYLFEKCRLKLLNRFIIVVTITLEVDLMQPQDLMEGST